MDTRPYLIAIDEAFGEGIDYALLVKLYGHDPARPETRYSPGDCIGARREVVSGDPDPGAISTSYVERQNLTIRMGMRRFTRLTKGSPRKP